MNTNLSGISRTVYDLNHMEMIYFLLNIKVPEVFLIPLQV